MMESNQKLKSWSSDGKGVNIFFLNRGNPIIFTRIAYMAWFAVL